MEAILKIGKDEVALHGDLAEVSSASQAGSRHNVAFGRCDCKGYQYRGTCRHLDAVQAAQAIQAAQARCPRCGRLASVTEILEHACCALCRAKKATR